MVAPTRMDDGLILVMKSANTLAYVRTEKCSSSFLSYTKTWSTPYASSSSAFSPTRYPINSAYTGWPVTAASSLALPISSNVTGCTAFPLYSTYTATARHSSLLIPGSCVSIYSTAPPGPFFTHSLHILQPESISTFPSLQLMAPKGHMSMSWRMLSSSSCSW